MIDLEEILSRMNPNQKINYDRVMQQMAKRWAQEEVRPKILVHVCCAPCSTYTLEYLTQYADVTVYFANSNIHPKDEYLRRAYVVQKFISEFNEKTENTVSIHWYSKSWMSKSTIIRSKITQPLHRIFGVDCFKWIKQITKKES